MKLMEYEHKGMKLNANDLMVIHHYYEAACTAEFLIENGNIEDEYEALMMGYEVRRLMDKYDMTEDEAIEELFDGE